MTNNHEKSRPAKTSYFEGSMMRNACFPSSGPLIFPSIFHQNFVFFQERLLDLIFLRFFRNFTRKMRFGHPCWTPWEPKWRSKSVQVRQKWCAEHLPVPTFRVLGAAWCPRGRPREPKDRPRHPKPDFLQVLNGFFMIFG